MSLVVVAWVSAQTPTVPDLGAYPWLYLRDGKALAAGEQVVNLIAVGDVMLSRGVAEETQPLAGVAPWLREADLALGNLECVVAEKGTPRPGPYRLRAPLSAVAAVRQAGFDILGLANNHALDLGPAALAESVGRLQEAGLSTVGAGPDVEAAHQPLVREVEGLRMAFLALNAIPDPEDNPRDGGWTPARWDQARATAAVAAARAQADIVVVSIHWGYEYDLRADPSQRAMGQAMIDAGADLVIGHHPHVVQGSAIGPRGPVETSRVVRDGFVAYSLGNLVFDQQQGDTRQGLALRAFFDRQGLQAVQALPLWTGAQPRLMTPDEAASLLARVRPDPAWAGPMTTAERGPDQGTTAHRGVYNVGFVCGERGCSRVDMPEIGETGLFRAGEIDLTGDGVPEQVRRDGDQAAIYSDTVEVWRSRPEWEVADLAVGDANDDGRGEVLLALWKPDSEGVTRNQPFIIGYRGGAYRILWAGSAVADPMAGLELGDVDGDGVQELVVLEERGDGYALTLWRWHGWGFSLVWRSPSGRYRDLALVSGEAGSPPTVSVAVEP